MAEPDGADDPNRGRDGSEPRRQTPLTVLVAALGMILFSPLVLSAFDRAEGGTGTGTPAVFVYLFVAWLAVIALTATVSRR